MRSLAAAGLLTIALAFAGGGCGSTDTATPAACLEDSGSYLRALQRAPAEVSLEGIPISDCLVENQSGGQLATVGGAMVRAATELNAEGRAEPTGPAPLRLGYLVGAARSGAEGTAGIHSELIRRLEAAARYSPGGRPLPPSFRDDYEKGLEAGRERG